MIHNNNCLNSSFGRHAGTITLLCPARGRGTSAVVDMRLWVGDNPTMRGVCLALSACHTCCCLLRQHHDMLAQVMGCTLASQHARHLHTWEGIRARSMTHGSDCLLSSSCAAEHCMQPKAPPCFVLATQLSHRSLCFSFTAACMAGRSIYFCVLWLRVLYLQNPRGSAVTI